MDLYDIHKEITRIDELMEYEKNKKEIDKLNEKREKFKKDLHEKILELLEKEL